MTKLPVPEFIIYGMLCFLVGMLTGLTVGFIGIIFPIAIASVGGQIDMNMVVFIFISGVAGCMLTPTHLCLALTAEYFEADIRKVIRMVLGPEVVLLATATVGYFILR